MKYRTKVRYIEAFKYGEEEEPKWFNKNWVEETSNNVFVDLLIPNSGVVGELDTYRVQKGDWIVKSDSGISVIKDYVFRRIYELDE